MADRTLRARRADNRARLTRSDLLRYFFGPSCGASLCDAGAGREVELHHGVQPSNRRLGAPMDFEEGIDHVLRFGLSLEREWPLGE